MLRARRFRASADFDEVAEADVVIICVPTPLNKHREPDLSHVQQHGRRDRGALRRGQLVVLESPPIPGTTREIVKPDRWRRAASRCGADVLLAYSPEREDPGQSKFRTADIPKVVGGDDAASRLLAEALLRASSWTGWCRSPRCQRPKRSSSRENIFRCVNIALVNELKIIYAAWASTSGR